MENHPVVVVLADIRSAENVGAILRTADGAGASAVWLSGYTPAPVDRFGRPQQSIKKSALGAEEWVPWRAFHSHNECLEALKECGYAVVAVEQTPSAVPYTAYKVSRPTALVFGNEVEGVPDAFLDAADAHIDIPMRGRKESLNVSVAAGVVLYGIA